MDIKSSKLELVKLILTIDNQNIINRILDVLKSGKEDFWLELSDRERQEIKLGISQLKAGQRISVDDFLKKVS
jgi:hypothetical protein